MTVKTRVKTGLQINDTSCFGILLPHWMQMGTANWNLAPPTFLENYRIVVEDIVKDGACRGVRHQLSQ